MFNWFQNLSYVNKKIIDHVFLLYSICRILKDKTIEIIMLEELMWSKELNSVFKECFRLREWIWVTMIYFLIFMWKYEFNVYYKKKRIRMIIFYENEKECIKGKRIEYLKILFKILTIISNILNMSIYIMIY